MRKLIIIFIIFTTPLFAAKVERLGFYNIQELLEDDNLTIKIINLEPCFLLVASEGKIKT